MKKLTVIGLTLTATVVLLGLAHWSGIVSFNFSGQTAKGGFRNTGTLELVCDVDASRPINGLEQPPEVSRMTLSAGIDFDNQTGWYEGEFAISRNRKGSLTVDLALLSVHRSAMFIRYGLNVTGEHFTLDRSNGEFRQWLALKDGKKLDIVSGHCKRTTNAPF